MQFEPVTVIGDHHQIKELGHPQLHHLVLLASLLCLQVSNHIELEVEHT